MLRTPSPLDDCPPAGVSWEEESFTPAPRRASVPNPPDAAQREAEHDAIDAAQAGDRHAFATLVNLYWDRLHRWLFHLTRDSHQADDLVQETFLKALAALGSFQPGSNFRAWLFRIGHNNFVNMKRTANRTKGTLPDEVPSPARQEVGEQLADREALGVVHAAIAELPPEFRSALMLHCQEGLSYREIAAIVKTTEETARWRVFKARQKLVKVLNPELLPPSAQPDS